MQNNPLYVPDIQTGNGDSEGLWKKYAEDKQPVGAETLEKIGKGDSGINYINNASLVAAKLVPKGEGEQFVNNAFKAILVDGYYDV